MGKIGQGLTKGLRLLIICIGSGGTKSSVANKYARISAFKNAGRMTPSGVIFALLLFTQTFVFIFLYGAAAPQAGKRLHFEPRLKAGPGNT